MRHIFRIRLATLLVVVAISSAAAAGPTKWDAGLGSGFGAFGVSGKYAREQHAEGGWVMRLPLHLRIRDWAMEGDLMFGRGAAENVGFDDYRFTSFGIHAKRYLTLRHQRNRGAAVYLEAYVRGSAQRLNVGHAADDPIWGLGYGAGLQARLSLGRKNVRPSIAYWIDLGRVYTGSSGPEDGHADSRFQTITFGLTLLGLGR